MDHTRVPQAGVFDAGVLRVWDDAAVASFGNAQTVDRGARSFSNGIVKLLAGGIETDSDCPWKLLDGFPCILLATSKIAELHAYPGAPP